MDAAKARQERWENSLPTAVSEITMQAAVYTGNGTVDVQAVPVPEIGRSEMLIRVEACGICHTDLKKIEYDLLPPPRIYGHETAGIVASVGAGVKKFAPGDRVIVFHHIPCMECFYCRHKLFAQCAVYKKVGVTAGYEAAGGGFSQYVRVMDWIVERGVEKIPDGVSFDQACFVEPVNTCVKAVAQMDFRLEDVVIILGQGPIGLIFTMLAKRAGVTILATDGMPHRRGLAVRFGAKAAFAPGDSALEKDIAALTNGRGADTVIVAASAPGIVEQAVKYSRPGSKILLFAQTSHKERVDLSGADICVGERMLFGSYSASVDLQAESANLVFNGDLPVSELISHRFPIGKIRAGIDLALHPEPQSLKIVIYPQVTERVGCLQ
jgi:L-iditol 2-dehydrogenase